MPLIVKDKRFTIIGAARSGIAAANAIRRLGGIARISEYKLEIPSLEDQNKYSEITETMFDLQDKLSAENRRLQEARDLLIPRLVGGKLEIKNI